MSAGVDVSFGLRAPSKVPDWWPTGRVWTPPAASFGRTYPEVAQLELRPVPNRPGAVHLVLRDFHLCPIGCAHIRGDLLTGVTERGDDGFVNFSRVCSPHRT